ncbi:MAG: ABC transporter, permease protein 1 (cluster 5, nickel/peptides/opines) [uncultured Thermomicrobiales bacterium]|uniref:ABC transporter, permease protein 1 (Cluster 5, nickel/peptides/opines) n=1 Tax=uncultured Thermomicrobiales bacterium TaxID=1645740 RepID=A0A6J4TY15_9BACT|nr:MAG: ABC transporter, permease protein 1 (cluster 5, nickel/peptides/opines) [uncultured Thermomicrobiales bacterium]
MIARLVVRRLFFLIFVLIGLSVITFVLSRVVAGDPARVIAGPRASRAQVERIRELRGFDDPLPVQYVAYVRDLARLDFGESAATKNPVREDLGRYLPATLELAFYAFLLSTVLGVPMGVLSASRRDTAVDHLSRVVAITGLAVPVFWLALMAQFLFYGKLGWLPDGERLPFGTDPPRTITSLYTVDALLTGEWETLRIAARHLLLPTVTLAYGSLAVVSRMVRSGMLEVLNQDYIRTARAKGLIQRRVIVRHALKNALMPTVTTLGLQIGLLLSGAFLVEIVFSWPGIGRYAVTAIEKIDYNATMATTLVIALIFVGVNLLVDILYLFLDPRISYE